MFFERRRPQSRLRIFTEWIVRKTLNSESGKAPKAHSPNLTPSEYAPRLIEQRLDFPMGAFGCAEIIGPKWCGKTWTAPSRSISVSRAKGKTERCPHVRARHRFQFDNHTLGAALGYPEQLSQRRDTTLWVFLEVRKGPLLVDVTPVRRASKGED